MLHGLYSSKITGSLGSQDGTSCSSLRHGAAAQWCFDQPRRFMHLEAEGNKKEQGSQTSPITSGTGHLRSNGISVSSSSNGHDSGSARMEKSLTSITRNGPGVRRPEMPAFDKHASRDYVMHMRSLIKDRAGSGGRGGRWSVPIQSQPGDVSASLQRADGDWSRKRSSFTPGALHMPIRLGGAYVDTASFYRIKNFIRCCSNIGDLLQVTRY